MNATTVKLSVRQWASEDRPSYKLQNLGAECLSDSELLAILVGSGTAQMLSGLRTPAFINCRLCFSQL